ncbi:LysR family transcriptional regulator [Granulicella tundricola]|uniref:Transcriptional regulator, LysR family n=1 Tax=Granulicella tundricola (strain ATCC BAA-1859 / DSM 23138 / MP5ACTX9) TaxID=1198114 RepID=E8X1G8_GRATM|nr:LysR family transcriptional regulator [Granulicella tundricola]ADW70203.1 transcriptional regulator, LysR family [Granulicella tundricola MP5ACTX9]
MSESVELRHLKYIVAVAETGNFTRAAQRLYVSQPALSKQIKDIEEEIGFQIFLRTPDGVFPTPVGQMIVDYAVATLYGHNYVFRMAKEIYLGNVPNLRVGFSSFVNARHLHTFRTSYARHFPKCVLQLSGGDTVNILQRVERGDLDCAILNLPVVGSHWQVVPLASSPIVVCMRTDDPLTEKSIVTVSDLSERLTVFRDPEGHPSAHARLTQMLTEAGIALHISCSAATPHDIQLLVRDGFGLALVSEDTLLESDITTRRIAGVSWTCDTAFVYQPAAVHPALSFVEKFIVGTGKRLLRKEVMSERPQLSLSFDRSA